MSPSIENQLRTLHSNIQSYERLRRARAAHRRYSNVDQYHRNTENMHAILKNLIMEHHKLGKHAEKLLQQCYDTRSSHNLNIRRQAKAICDRHARVVKMLLEIQELLA